VTGGVSRRARQRKRWKPFGEAREYVRGLGLKNGAQWREYCRTSEKPADIPSTPYKVYRDKWIGWGDWLGTGNIHGGKRGSWRRFEEAREFVRGLGLKNSKEWQEYRRGAKSQWTFLRTPMRFTGTAVG
jgi:hypothetical protein